MAQEKLEGPGASEKQMFKHKGESLPVQKYKDSAMADSKGKCNIEGPTSGKEMFKPKKA